MLRKCIATMALSGSSPIFAEASASTPNPLPPVIETSGIEFLEFAVAVNAPVRMAAQARQDSRDADQGLEGTP